MSNDTISLVDVGGTPGRKRAPKAAAVPAAKRAGRPAAPQTLTEAKAAYLAKLQGARKAIYDAVGLLTKFGEFTDTAEVGGANWTHLSKIGDVLNGVDFRLHTAQRMIDASSFQHPTDKVV